MFNRLSVCLIAPLLLLSPRSAPDGRWSPPQAQSACTSAAVRASPYQPEYQLPADRQLVALYIGASDCAPCRVPETKAAVREMKSLLACQAKATHRSLAIIGVSLDWDVDTAVAFLEETAPYDEILGGGNWVNLGALTYIWRDGRAPAIPQVILLERAFDPQKTPIRVTEERELARFIGAGEFQAWVKRGAPIPATSPP
jgi:hypothetical protein